MHILFGLLVAAALLVWWVRGGVVPAVMGLIVAGGMMVVAVMGAALPGMVISLIVGAVAWAPIYLRKQRPVTILSPTGAVQPYRR